MTEHEIIIPIVKSKRKAIRAQMFHLTNFKDYDIQKSAKELPKNIQDGDNYYHIMQTKSEIKIKISNKSRIKFIKNIPNETSFIMPENLMAKLEIYQEQGVNWMLNKLLKEKGCILADDMGLGKTLQIITLILFYKNHGIVNKNVILVPKMLVKQWHTEIEKFAPILKVHIYKKQPIPECDVILFSYNQAIQHFNVFDGLLIHLLVIDEAHVAKTYKAAITTTFKKIKASKIILVTGTPIENSFKEGLCLLDFIKPNIYKDVINKVTNPNRFHWDDFLQVIETWNSSVLRRLKNKAIIKDLPNKITKNIKCTLTKGQIKMYKCFALIDDDHQTIYKEKGGGPVILKLREICSDPFMINHEGSKICKLLKIINSLEEKEKMLVFTQSTTTLHNLAYILKDRQIKAEISILDGTLSLKERNERVISFNKSSKNHIFLISLKTGGQGLNLQSASTVVHYDLWWNKSAESQATARSHRRGQTKTVKIYRLIVTNVGLELSIDKLIQKKDALANDIYSLLTDNQKITSVTLSKIYFHILTFGFPSTFVANLTKSQISNILKSKINRPNQYKPSNGSNSVPELAGTLNHKIPADKKRVELDIYDVNGETQYGSQK